MLKFIKNNKGGEISSTTVKIILILVLILLGLVIFFSKVASFKDLILG
ncbi:MAG: hypothetical protein KC589_10705 [Nanoarchaeota archaeon]|nr:hypothetical protein [Nanoarchaeota archaeon]